MRKYRLLLLGLNLLCFYSLQAQTIITGQVSSTEGKSLDYFNIVFENPADSTYVGGDIYYEPTFKCTLPKVQPLLLHFSSLGYEDQYYLVSSTTNNAPINVMMKPMMIDNIVVTAKTISSKAGNTMVLVNGSQLQKLPDVVEIFKRIPTVRATEDGISFLGRGTPLIYIDNRKASYEQLKLLQPSDIASIEVDRNPSARYSAQAVAVLKIKTNRTKEGFSAQIFDQATQRRNFNNTVGIQAQMNTKKWYNYISFTHQYGHIRDYTNTINTLTTKDSFLQDTSSSDASFKWHHYNLIYGSQLKLGKKGRLDGQYYFVYAENPLKSNLDQQTEHIWENGEFSKVLNTKVYNRKSFTTHWLNLGYEYTIDTTSYFRADASMIYVPLTQDNYIFQTQKDKTDQLHIANTNIHTSVSGSIAYQKKINAMTLDCGAEYNYIHGDGSSNYNGENTIVDFRNHTIDVYCTLGADYPKWGYVLGLRDEVFYDQTKANHQLVRGQWENNIFPTAKIYTNSLWKSVTLSLSYYSTIRHPSTEELLPIKEYRNSITVDTGNPLLKSAITHRLSLSATLYKNLSITADYTYRKNGIESTGISDGDGGILFLPINLDKKQSGNFIVSYTNQWGKFSLTADAVLSYHYARIPFMNQIFTNERVAFDCSVNFSWDITKTTSVWGYASYQSRSAGAMAIYEPTNYCSVGISQALLKNRMRISFSVQDIFRGANSDWYDRYEGYQAWQFNNRDSRQYQLSISYSFNKFRSKYQMSQAPRSLNRIQ